MYWQKRGGEKDLKEGDNIREGRNTEREGVAHSDPLSWSSSSAQRWKSHWGFSVWTFWLSTRCSGFFCFWCQFTGIFPQRLRIWLTATCWSASCRTRDIQVWYENIISCGIRAKVVLVCLHSNALKQFKLTSQELLPH